jgi:NAD(P)-dependent dehydrogenase (short-subunit alcohol dehydrogenase family)
MALAREGAIVVVADRAIEGGEETVRLTRDAGGEGCFVRTDVTDEAEVAALVGRTVERWGRLDLAFNNAGIARTGVPVHETAEDDWDAVIAVNLKGVWLAMKHEIPAMLRVGGGSIVNTASAAGLLGLPGAASYSASKHAVIGLTRTAALEYATMGVRVNAICPGFVRTPMVDRLIGGDPEVEQRLHLAQPIGRMGSPEEIAALVVWLCSDSASFVTGAAYSIDGGLVAR